MDRVKELAIENFRHWLQEVCVGYKELANGHFQIFQGDTLVFQVWATTEKMAVQDGPMVVGLNLIQRTIEAKCRPESTQPKVKVDRTSDLRKHFLEVYNTNRGHMFDCILVVAVYLPSGATEIITNHYDVESKMEYYIATYDDEFRLKANNKVKITGFMLV